MTRTMAAAAALIAVMLGSGSAALADKLQDFKDAVAAPPGCGSIPYKNLFEQCDGKGKVMHEWCDGPKGPITCNEGVTRNLKDTLEREKQTYEKLKDKKHDLEDQKYHASDDAEKARLQSEIDAVSKQIDDSERAINALKDNLDKRKELVSKTISTIETCIDHRRAIMNVFAEALDRVRNENDDDIKPLARTLRDRFEESKRGHEIAITDKENARNNCKPELP